MCRAALGCFIGFLRRSRILPDQPKPRAVLTGADRLVHAFDQHLGRVQGLSATTRRARRRYARELLVWRFGKKPLRIRAILPRDLFRFVNVRARTLSATSLHALAVGLRSFLRFLELTGRIRRGLAYAVPAPVSPPRRQPAQLLDRQAKLRFLGSFNRATSVGRRNYAIALCLSELALRANEVVEMTLDTWPGVDRLYGCARPNKGASGSCHCPLQWLEHWRITCGEAALSQPIEPSSSAIALRSVSLCAWMGVRHMIRRAFAECGLEAAGPHLLRQAWATAAYRRGTGLKLIAGILGHGSLDTTAPYTQVQFEELRQAALPWPRKRA
jgi:site-specific recombinase XerD